MIYIHVPFCRSRCVYCSFFSQCDDGPTQRWADEVCAEALSRKDEIAASSAVNTLYFGGGTPSVLPLEYIGRIADACGGRQYDEWTVEVNPDDITLAYAAGLRALGVNRVSMGVQSLDDGMLRWMRRRHTSDGARRAFRMLRDAGFDNISVDIIFGINGMDNAMLESTVEEIVLWHPEHISAYQLSIEEGSALQRLSNEGRYEELPDEECSAQYYQICTILSAAEYDHYEISNWALPGRRAVHNSAYWSRAPYVGLGPGAHSLNCAPTTIPLHPQGTGEESPETPSVATLRSAGEAGLLGTGNFGSLRTESSGGVAAEPVAARGHVNGRGPQAQRSGRDERSEGFLVGEPTPNVRSWNSEDLSGWTSECEVLTEGQIREERIMLGLRTAEGIPGYGRIPEERWFVADDIISSLL